MTQKIGYVTLLVREYDEAIDFYTRKLGFLVKEDTRIDEHKRWVLVTPPSNEGTHLLLARAATAAQQELIGNQTGGRVFLFLHTDDFWRDYENMRSKGVHFLEEPRDEKYGRVVVFEDLYGNKWDLLELPHTNH